MTKTTSQNATSQKATSTRTRQQGHVNKGHVNKDSTTFLFLKNMFENLKVNIRHVEKSKLSSGGWAVYKEVRAGEEDERHEAMHPKILRGSGKQLDTSHLIYCANSAFAAAMAKAAFPDVNFFNQKFPLRVLGNTTEEVVLERAFHLWYRVNLERGCTGWLMYDETVYCGSGDAQPGFLGEWMEEQKLAETASFDTDGVLKTYLCVINPDGEAVLIHTEQDAYLHNLAPVGAKVMGYFELCAKLEDDESSATVGHQVALRLGKRLYELEFHDFDNVEFDVSADFPKHPRWQAFEGLKGYFACFSSKEKCTMLID